MRKLKLLGFFTLFLSILISPILIQRTVFADAEKAAIVKIYPFGNSTVMIDSTNYIKIRKGWYVGDSLLVGKDAYIKGVLYLDTNKEMKLYYNGYDFFMKNLKTNSTFNITIGKGGGFSEPSFTVLTVDAQLLYLDSNSGLTINYGSIKGKNFLMTNPTGAETCGEGTLSEVTGAVTISTTAIHTSPESIVQTTPSVAGYTGTLYVDNYVNGTSFDVTSTAGVADGNKTFYWTIINR